jgi:DNA repair protein RadD
MGRHTGVAGDEEPLSDNKPPEMVPVDDVTYHKHVKRGGESKPTMRVEYRCGFSIFKEWICLEHTEFARLRAERWWRLRAPGDIPDTVDDALEIVDRLEQPSAIKVDTSGRYATIVSHQFDRGAQEARR